MELKILSVYGKGEGPLAAGGNDTLFTTVKVEAEEPRVQVGDHLLIHRPEERLPPFHLQHTPKGSTHLYGSMCC